MPVHMRLTPPTDRGPIRVGCWRPYYSRYDVARWLKEAALQICCVCNTFQKASNVFPLNERDNTVLNRVPNFHYAESDVDMPDGVQWGAEGPLQERRICSKCRRHMARTNLVPPYAWTFLRQPAVPSVLRQLNRIEKQLVARGTVAQKVVLLPRGQQPAVIGSCCSYLLDQPRMYAALQEGLLFLPK